MRRLEVARRGRSTVGLLVGLLGMSLAIAAYPVSAADGDGADGQGNRREGLIFGPRLLYYPLVCRNPRGCRIECFQNGTSVFNHAGITQQDEVRLVVNAGISDELIPRWLEIRPFNDQTVRTLLMTRETVCEFDSMLIVPRHSP